jgi:hypothetical protein
MRFARIVFRIAGVWGILVLTPLFFLADEINRRFPPPITHPQYFYGFVALAWVFQLVFFVIAADPVRYRALIVPAILEKAGWVLTCFVLMLRGGITSGEASGAAADLLLGILFIRAFFTTRTKSSSELAQTARPI